MVKDDYGKTRLLHSPQGRGGRAGLCHAALNAYHTNIETALANAYFLGKALNTEAFADIEPPARAEAIFELFLGIKAYEHLQKAGYGYGQAAFDDGAITIH